MAVFSCRLSARAVALVGSAALFSVFPAGAAAQISSIVSVEVLQPGPGRIQEDYRAGSDILVSVRVVIPIEAPAAELFLSLEAGDLHPVVFAPRFTTQGARQWCENSTNSPKVSVHADLLVIDHKWMNGTHPGARALTSDGMGSSAGVTVSAGDPAGQEGSAQREVVYSVAFAVVCDDDLAEQDEQFTVRAWLTPANQQGRSAPSGAVARSVLVIDDDTLRPPRNLVLSASGTTVTASWDEPPGTGSVQPGGYDLRHREVGPGDTGWITVALSGPETLTHDVTGLKPGTTYRFQVRSTKSGSTPSAWSGDVRITPGRPEHRQVALETMGPWRREPHCCFGPPGTRMRFIGSGPMGRMVVGRNVELPPGRSGGGLRFRPRSPNLRRRERVRSRTRLGWRSGITRRRVRRGGYSGSGSGAGTPATCRWLRVRGCCPPGGPVNAARRSR